jgi:hypothetical protein
MWFQISAFIISHPGQSQVPPLVTHKIQHWTNTVSEVCFLTLYRWLPLTTGACFQIFRRLNVDNRDPHSRVSNAGKDISARFISFDNSEKKNNEWEQEQFISVYQYLLLFSAHFPYLRDINMCLPIITSISTDEPSHYHAITDHSGIVAFNFLMYMAS